MNLQAWEYKKYWLEARPEDYCWVIKIKNISELLSFFNLRIQPKYVDAYFTLYNNVTNNRHIMSHVKTAEEITLALYAELEGKLDLKLIDKSILEKNLLPKLEIMQEHGCIYISKRHGFFPGTLHKIQRLSEESIFLNNPNFVGLPEIDITSIHLAKWEDGDHFYLYINKDWYKNLKFDNEEKAKKYINKNFPEYNKEINVFTKNY